MTTRTTRSRRAAPKKETPAPNPDTAAPETSAEATTPDAVAAELTTLHLAGRSESIAAGNYDPEARLLTLPLMQARGPQAGTEPLVGAPFETRMPTITGLASEEASKTVRSAGFSPIFVEIATAEHPAGQVFGQFLEPNTSWLLRLPVIAVVAKP